MAVKDKHCSILLTWKWFTKGFLKMPHRQSILEVQDWLKLVNEKVRILVKIFCYFVYYLVIASIAYTTTRDQGDYFAESDLSNMETHAQPAFYYKWVWFVIVFFVLLM